MKLMIHKADGTSISEFELNGDDAKSALAELRTIGDVDRDDDEAENEMTDSQFIVHDLVHCLRRCAMGSDEKSNISISMADKAGTVLGQHDLTPNSSIYSLQEMDIWDFSDQVFDENDELAGKFAIQDITHMLRRCSRGMTE